MSYTTAATATITHARHIAAKIAADLKRVQRLVGRGEPTDQEIADYKEEATILLCDGYLGTVTYGFKKNRAWILAMQYTASYSDLRSVDHDPGNVPVGNVDGAVFSSFLSYSQTWQKKSREKKEAYKRDMLPFVRTPGYSPEGEWTEDSSYRSGGIEVVRRSLDR